MGKLDELLSDLDSIMAYAEDMPELFFDLIVDIKDVEASICELQSCSGTDLPNRRLRDNIDCMYNSLIQLQTHVNLSVDFAESLIETTNLTLVLTKHGNVEVKGECEVD